MIIDKIRDEKEFYEMFKKYPMDDGIFDYNFLINNNGLYCFYDEEKGFLRGYINIYRDEENRLFLSGASIRKNMPDNIQAIIKVCNSYNENMYADTDKLEAKICLVKAGFKRLKDYLYVRYIDGQKI